MEGSKEQICRNFDHVAESLGACPVGEFRGHPTRFSSLVCQFGQCWVEYLPIARKLRRMKARQEKVVYYLILNVYVQQENALPTYLYIYICYLLRIFLPFSALLGLFILLQWRLPAQTLGIAQPDPSRLLLVLVQKALFDRNDILSFPTFQQIHTV